METLIDQIEELKELQKNGVKELKGGRFFMVFKGIL